jgi:hypothetical protein
MVPVHKIETFRGARDFFDPLNGTSDSEGHFGAKKVDLFGPKMAKKVSGSLKSRDFVQRDHFKSLKWPHLVIFKEFIS